MVGAEGMTDGAAQELLGCRRGCRADAGVERSCVVVDADVVDARFELAALVGLPGEGRSAQEGRARGGPEDAADQWCVVFGAWQHAYPGVFVAGAVGPDRRRVLDEADLAGGAHGEPLSLGEVTSAAATAAISRWVTASTTASVRRSPEWRPEGARRAAHPFLEERHTRFPRMRLAVEPRRAPRGHGDALVLRGLSELPVVLGR